METSFHNVLTSPAKAVAVILLVLLLNTACQAQLTSTFYDNSCPNALSAIRTSIRNSIAAERRMAASLIRLHFHDCFVQGCDASILLEDTPSIESEQTALPNKDSARGYRVIEKAKSEVEKICPGVVSCADILAVAARDASAYVGGPSWTVMLGRRDSTTASRTLANSELPSFKDGLDRLISRFQSKGLSARDMVALSGSHTIGQAQCFTFRDRIYSNGTDIDSGFASTRKRICPAVGGDANLAPFDLVTLILLTTIISRILYKRKVFLSLIKFFLAEVPQTALFQNIAGVLQLSAQTLLLP
ncbi:hypothetical protein GH714_008044 [Hevea brasiliensis]|uniref:Peroxidase n=1 Tax=Hevea brasiliensis TaxID=3981 RepID=A0A6A6LZF3_HEVBR|nr:hypothetical protein GH714_008044 [Hevea brasiliensis]